MTQLGNKTNQSITIVNYNTYGVPLHCPHLKFRYVEIAKILEDKQPDVITLQEVFTYPSLNLLKRSLPSYAHVAYKPTYLGPHGGLVTFSKYPINDSNYYGFDSFFHKLLMPNLWPILIHSSGCLITYLKDSPFIIMNTHVSPNHSGDWSPDDDAINWVQTKELTMLCKLISKTKIDGKIILICGGINIPKRGRLYNKFFKASKFIDAFLDNNEPTFVQKYLKDGLTAECVDYILLGYDKNSHIINKELLFQNKIILPNGGEEYLSDHYGLFASMNFGVDSIPVALNL